MKPKNLIIALQAFIDQYRNVASPHAESYRVIGVSSKQEPFLSIQVIGKNTIFRALPENLMHHKMLMGFSKADIAIIIHLGTKREIEKRQSEAKPKHFMRIAQQLFGLGGKTKFLLKVPEQDQLMEAIPEEVMCNKEALNRLEGAEAALVGYAAAENRMLDIRKQTSSAVTCRIMEHDLKNNVIVYVDEERETRHVLPLRDIVNNKMLFNLFGKTDQHMLSFAAGEMHQQRLQPRTKVTTLRLSSYLGDFAQFSDLSGGVKSMPFSELAFEAELLDQFSQQDRDMIRFAAGEFSAQKKASL
jgi:hypothetical protein